MRLIDPYAPFFTYKKIIAKYGGEFSFFEKLKLGGIGSPKVSYRSGIPEFDSIQNLDELEKSITNFELLKKGIIIRINKKQKMAVAIEWLDSIAFIQLIPEAIQTNGQSKRKGQLTIAFKGHPSVVCDVGVEEYEGVERFFKKKAFEKYLH